MVINPVYLKLEISDSYQPPKTKVLGVHFTLICPIDSYRQLLETLLGLVSVCEILLIPQ